VIVAMAALLPLLPMAAADVDGADPSRALAAVAALARDAQVIAIGESHDNPAHHEIQAQVLERLVALGERPVLAFEMLSEEQQTTVDAALRDGGSVEDLERRLNWQARGWPDFRMYFPLFEIARRYGLPVLAADLDTAARRTITRGGIGALAEPERERAASRLPADPEREDDLRAELGAAHCGLLPAEVQASMAQAWHARNVTMARRIAGALADGRTVVLIAGRAHLAPHAVPGQLDAVRPGTRLRVVDLAERDGDPPLPNASLVWTTPSVTRPDRCDELRRHPPMGQSRKTAS
jgi:uncharacterized iron-regulated protein